MNTEYLVGKMDMSVANTDNVVRKASKRISNVANKTSCSNGWLHLMIQCFFGAITIISFILILYSTMSSTGFSRHKSRCGIDGCTIVCHDTPEFRKFEDDIFSRVSEASIDCNRVVLSLNNPMFENATMPARWLSDLRSNIHQLRIIGGNLNYITPEAFVTPFAGSVHRLVLERITLIRWEPQTLVGLSNLIELILGSCTIVNVAYNALDAVDNTLLLFSIIGSGRFDPHNLIGSGAMEMITEKVVFTDNNLGDILNRDSFTNLKKCKDLYLNSNNITAIGYGTFDNLTEIQSIYLNDNKLKTLPIGIFDTIMTITNPRVRINLQNNLWHCDCGNGIPQWVEEGILMLDVQCHYPFEVRGQMFSDFVGNCHGTGYPRSEHFDFNALSFYNRDILYSNGTCARNLNSIQTIIYQSPLDFLSCPESNKQHILDLINTSIRELIIRAQNELMRSKFTLRADSFSMMEIFTAGPSIASNYGLVWFQSECPDEVFCINTMPTVLRVYNVNADVQYTFCPIHLTTGYLNKDKCIYYNVPPMQVANLLQVLTYMSTVVLCLTFGACIVYAIIRKFPHLLKGSDRILFVKHKDVDALVLPTKINLKSVNSTGLAEVNEDIFVLFGNKVKRSSLERMISFRSAKSAAPSYISALQPTDEQLTEWRLRHHFDNDLTITSGVNVPYLRFSDDETLYCSISEDTNITLQNGN